MISITIIIQFYFYYNSELLSQVDDGPYTGNESVSTRMSSPLVSTQLKTDNIEFWREKVRLETVKQLRKASF